MKVENQEPINLACSINESYVLPFAVTLFSLLTNSSKKYAINLFIIDSGVLGPTKEKLNDIFRSSLVNLRWIPIPESLCSDLPLWGRHNMQVYHSIFLDRLLPEDIHKVLFLDTDLLILGNIEDLWDEELDHSMLAAVQDMAIPVVSAPMGLACYKDLGLSALAPYFNAGVLLINLKKWRSTNTTDKAVAYLKENHTRVALHDQDGFNAVLSSSWKAIDLRWNVIASIAGRSFFEPQYLDKEQYKRAAKDPWIIHYAGYLKPWQANLGNPFDKIYKDYLAGQNWFNGEVSEDFSNKIFGFYDRHLRQLFYPIERFLWNKLR